MKIIKHGSIYEGVYNKSSPICPECGSEDISASEHFEYKSRFFFLRVFKYWEQTCNTCGCKWESDRVGLDTKKQRELDFEKLSMTLFVSGLLNSIGAIIIVCFSRSIALGMLIDSVVLIAISAIIEVIAIWREL